MRGFHGGWAICAAGVFLAASGCGSRGSTGGPTETHIASAKETVTAEPEQHCAYKQFSGHDYWFCDTPHDWTTAQSKCNAVSMHLAHIDNALENQFIGANVDGSAWIGASDQQTPNQWTWNDDNSVFWTGTSSGSATPGAFSSWAFAEPRSGGQCAAMEPPFNVWGAQPCNVWHDYVCESSAATSSAPQAPAVGCTRASRNGHDYWFCGQPTSATQARANCRGIGLDLATIDDSSENAFVASNLQTDSFIGLSDSGAEGVWKWDADSRLDWCGGAQGKPAVASAYANWEPFFPAVSASCTYQTRAGHDYWFCSDLRTYAQAEAACESNGQTLVRVDDAAENTFVKSNSPGEAWLGGSDASAEGHWTWVAGNQSFWSGGPNGSTLNGLFANWLLGEPKIDSSRNCLVLEPDGHWNDHGCALVHSWACEGPHSAKPQIPDDLDCSRMRRSLGGWSNTKCGTLSGYVCETPPPNAGLRLMGAWTTDGSRRLRDDGRVAA